ncbi:MAG: hypothetical protein JWN72_1488 [Thermoleophilia bacterium]|nr:hypothetical protein [Thermoleophilia bacterium]
MHISPAVMVATPLAAAAVFGTAAYLATEHHVVTPRGEPWP